MPSTSTVPFISGSTQLTTIVDTLAHREFAIYPSLAFAAVAFLMVLLAENARIPIDNPSLTIVGLIPPGGTAACNPSGLQFGPDLRGRARLEARRGETDRSAKGDTDEGLSTHPPRMMAFPWSITRLLPQSWEAGRISRAWDTNLC